MCDCPPFIVSRFFLFSLNIFLLSKKEEESRLEYNGSASASISKKSFNYEWMKEIKKSSALSHTLKNDKDFICANKLKPKKEEELLKAPGVVTAGPFIAFAECITASGNMYHNVTKRREELFY